MTTGADAEMVNATLRDLAEAIRECTREIKNLIELEAVLAAHELRRRDIDEEKVQEILDFVHSND